MGFKAVQVSHFSSIAGWNPEQARISAGRRGLYLVLVLTLLAEDEVCCLLRLGCGLDDQVSVASESLQPRANVRCRVV